MLAVRESLAEMQGSYLYRDNSFAPSTLLVIFTVYIISFLLVLFFLAPYKQVSHVSKG